MYLQHFRVSSPKLIIFSKIIVDVKILENEYFFNQCSTAITPESVKENLNVNGKIDTVIKTVLQLKIRSSPNFASKRIPGY